jgi:MYXO-CTERM domain-containing protein
LAASISAQAIAGPGSSSDVLRPANPAIFGGEEIEVCAWPTVVSVQTGGFLCTGALVHPRLVMFAAHCEPSATTRVRFGEDINDSKLVNPDLCEANPDWLGQADQGNDWAFCRLEEPIDLPTTPILYGCEEEALVPGAEVAIVGYGWNTETDGEGLKRWGLTTLNTVDLRANKAELGGDGGPSICPGDSGGPGLIRLADGSWRAWGIASTTTNGCGGIGTYGLMRGAIDWVQERSGIDLTSCFDADGEWEPNVLCDNFYAAEPAAAFGDYEADPWCLDTPATGQGDFCGDPLGDAPDEEPPVVTITTPEDQSDFPDNPTQLGIEVEAVDAGWGVETVWLEIDGQVVPLYDGAAPYTFDGLNFPGPASYSLVAFARDYAGQLGESEPVTVHVAQPQGGDESGEESSESGAEDESATVGSEGDPPQDEEPGGGCSCRSEGEGRGALGLFLILLWRRRRGV